MGSDLIQPRSKFHQAITTISSRVGVERLDHDGTQPQTIYSSLIRLDANFTQMVAFPRALRLALTNPVSTILILRVWVFTFWKNFMGKA